MDKVHNFLEMWQGSQNLCATEKKSHTQNKQMTAVGYISDTEGIVKKSWSSSQPDGAAALKLLERSPLAPALSTKDLSGGWTQIVNVRQIRGIDRHLVESHEHSAPETISDTKDWLDWNSDLDNPIDTEDDCAADVRHDMEHGNGIEDPECPLQWDSSAARNVPGSIWSTQKSKRPAQMVFVTVNTINTWRNK